MIPMGDEFAYENAYVTFLSMERVLDFINKNYKNLNINFKFSTPSEYIKAVKKDVDITKLSQYQGDFLPYQDKQGNVMSGYFSSRPDFKKEVKTTSSINHIENKLFARRVLNLKVSDSEIEDILKSKQNSFESVAVLDDQKSIQGLSYQFVQNFNLMKAEDAMDNQQNLFKGIISKEVIAETGIDIGSGA
jgi:hypothetical protein